MGDGGVGQERMKFFKYKKEGEEKMTDLIEEYAQKRATKAAKEAEYERNIEMALSLLADGMSVEFAAKHSKLSLDEVRKLAEKRSA